MRDLWPALSRIYYHRLQPLAVASGRIANHYNTAMENSIECIRKLQIGISEERDREGYLRQPQTVEEALDWEAEAVWLPE